MSSSIYGVQLLEPYDMHPTIIGEIFIQVLPNLICLTRDIFFLCFLLDVFTSFERELIAPCICSSQCSMPLQETSVNLRKYPAYTGSSIQFPLHSFYPLLFRSHRWRITTSAHYYQWRGGRQGKEERGSYLKRIPPSFFFSLN